MNEIYTAKENIEVRITIEIYTVTERVWSRRKYWNLHGKRSTIYNWKLHGERKRLENELGLKSSRQEQYDLQSKCPRQE